MPRRVSRRARRARKARQRRPAARRPRGSTPRPNHRRAAASAAPAGPAAWAQVQHGPVSCAAHPPRRGASWRQEARLRRRANEGRRPPPCPSNPRTVFVNFPTVRRPSAPSRPGWPWWACVENRRHRHVRQRLAARRGAQGPLAGVPIVLFSALLLLQGHRRLPVTAFAIGAAAGYVLAPNLLGMLASVGVDSPLDMAQSQLACAATGVMTVSVAQASLRMMAGLLAFIGITAGVQALYVRGMDIEQGEFIPIIAAPPGTSRAPCDGSCRPSRRGRGLGWPARGRVHPPRNAGHDPPSGRFDHDLVRHPPRGHEFRLPAPSRQEAGTEEGTRGLDETRR